MEEEQQSGQTGREIINRKIDILTARVSDLALAIAVMAEKNKQLNDDVCDTNAKIVSLGKQVESLDRAADRWKWSFLLIVGVGGFIGWFVSVWEKIWRVTH